MHWALDSGFCFLTIVGFFLARLRSFKCEFELKARKYY